MSSYSVTSSYGTSTDGRGKLTCDSNVPKPAKVLSPQEVTDSGIQGALGGFIVGLLTGGIPAVVTTPVGWLIGNRIAEETNAQANEINVPRNRYWGQAQADLAATGCNASNTTFVEGSRGAPEVEKK